MRATATTPDELRTPAALYPRLPRGPHRLDRPTVAHNQRARILGAMAQAVARSGYRGASVSRVVALAGVSRRSFYEHFANREACFLAAFDEIADRAGQRARSAWAGARGDSRDRVGIALAALAATVTAERDAAALVACEAGVAGGRPLAHLRRRLMGLERPLGEHLAPQGEPPLPGPVLRVVAGGLHGHVASALRRETGAGAPAGAGDGTPAASAALAASLSGWALPFAAASGGASLSRCLAAGAAARLREPPAPSRAARRDAGPSGGTPGRLLLMAGALRLAVLCDYEAVTPQQLADEAGVSARVLGREFEDTHACYLAALDEVSATVLGAVGGAAARQPGDWPQAVCGMLGAFLSTLAARPLRAHTLATGIHSAGTRALDRGEVLMLAVSRLLVAGAPRPAAAGTDRAIATGLMHAIGCQAASGRPRLLVALRDPLAFAVLTPHLGAGEAGALMIAAAGRS